MMKAIIVTSFVIIFLLVSFTADAFQLPQRIKTFHIFFSVNNPSQHDDDDDGSVSNNRRRRILTGSVSTIFMNSFVMPSTSNAAGGVSEKTMFPDLTQARSAVLPSGLLESRVSGNVMSPPNYGMESPDVFYPSWFAGSWKVFSECTSVEAPCGVTLFGGDTKYQAAINDTVGKSKALQYDCRFLRTTETAVIADREFNVRNIARVAIGPNSVVDVPMATPNKFACIMVPAGAPFMISVELLTLNRRQETIDDTHFDCSEVVREIVSPVGDSSGGAAPQQRRASILKEIETTSLYTLVNKDSVICRQRSATFLLPSQQDPMALRMWQATQGRPIDVRFYDVQYTRR